MPAARHTPEQKAAALAAYREFGPAEASRRTGISRETISAWARRTGIAPDAPETTHAAAEARTARLTALLWRIAESRAEWVAEQSSSKDVRHPMTVAAIAIDKAQLLSGKATQRVETIAAEEVVAIENIVQLRREAA